MWYRQKTNEAKEAVDERAVQQQQQQMQQRAEKGKQEPARTAANDMTIDVVMETT